MSFAPTAPSEPDPLTALLTWYVEMGVLDATGAAIGSSESEVEVTLPERPSASAPVASPVPMPPAAGPASVALTEAQRLAQGAQSLEVLRHELERFEGCALKQTATHTVFADGNPEADLLFIGEAPGREEDLRGLPFVGRSGQLLDRMLAAIGRDRQSAYIINILPWRPPANRNPTPEEMAVCLPFVLRHIELARPRVLVALGGVAAKQLLDTQTGIMRLRGQWQRVTLPNRTELPLLPIFHPAYLLRQPAHKQLAWRDFVALKHKLHDLSTVVS